ncbi:TetR/AcrR family transcriptional regulator [Thermoanaerobacterium sp. DL9XJH110]|uniref:TetR/AcrR family transcriptional regulator n=1 Tax=Thermoanaerobacterium sp. DL9XJH110 TaxID=3386643 RepID=UPI003BB67D7C
MRRKKRRKSEDLIDKRRHQILEAAVKVFSEKGFEGSTTKEIAKKARVSEGTIFRYFKTKKDILLNLINILTEKSLFQFIEDVEQGLDTRQALKNLLKLHYRLIIQNFELLKIIFYEIQFHKELREEFYKNVVSRVLSILEKNIAEQKIRTDVDPQLAAQTLLGIFIGIIMVRTMVEEHEGRQDEDKIISNILDILFNGIKKRD